MQKKAVKRKHKLITCLEFVYRVVQKIAPLLFSQKFQSWLRSHMNFDTRQFQHVFSQHIGFHVNLTKNVEIPDVLKKKAV